MTSPLPCADSAGARSTEKVQAEADAPDRAGGAEAMTVQLQPLWFTDTVPSLGLVLL